MPFREPGAERVYCSFSGTTQPPPNGLLVDGAIYANSGISFNSGTTTIANYTETGTWTPTVSGSTAGTGTYSTQTGNYQRIGNIVFIQAQVVWTAQTGAGNLLLTGFPFTVANLTNYTPGFACNLLNVTISGGTEGILCELQPNTTQATVLTIHTGAGNTPIALAGTGGVHFSAWYFT